MRPRLTRSSILLATVLLTAISGFANATTNGRVVPGQGPDGTFVTLETARSTTPTESEPIDATTSYDLLWHRFLADPIYTSTGISAPPGVVFVGNYLNAPRQAESISLSGSGTPTWVHPGVEFYVDAAREADVLAAIDYNPADSTATVKQWTSASSVPLWSFPIHGCRPLTAEGWSAGKGIQVSDDGSTIAALVNLFGAGGLKGRLVVFDSGSSTPVIDYPLPSGTASALAVTHDGSFIAIYAWPSIYVYDRYGDVLRWSGAAGSGNDALAISGDGQILTWGWSSLNVREWNGTSYQPLWTTSKSGHYLTECALTRDGSTLATAWYDGATLARTIVELYTLPDHALLWTYNYAPPSLAGAPEIVPSESRASVTEVVSELVFSNDDHFLAAASWGGTTPEIHVFESESSAPVAILDTPGTMFDIDVVSTAAGVYVAAAGKHVHAGQSGRGGDVYALVLPPVTGVDDESPSLANARIDWIGPVPSAGAISLRLSLSNSAPARITVRDVTGRTLVTLAEGLRGPSTSQLNWEGRDASGHPVAPGAYFVVLEGAGSVSAEKVVIVR